MELSDRGDRSEAWANGISHEESDGKLLVAVTALFVLLLFLLSCSCGGGILHGVGVLAGVLVAVIHVGNGVVHAVHFITGLLSH